MYSPGAFCHIAIPTDQGGNAIAGGMHCQAQHKLPWPPSSESNKMFAWALCCVCAQLQDQAPQGSLPSTCTCITLCTKHVDVYMCMLHITSNVLFRDGKLDSFICKRLQLA